ncbi:MAG: hypothetical protein LBG99_09080 [Propionibacteriaceae bacterium]|jgi:hypothetical protein|nr:hypothetical protein [Propionibacteriaceae bacterium]
MNDPLVPLLLEQKAELEVLVGTVQDVAVDSGRVACVEPTGGSPHCSARYEDCVEMDLGAHQNPGATIRPRCKNLTCQAGVLLHPGLIKPIQACEYFTAISGICLFSWSTLGLVG